MVVPFEETQGTRGIVHNVVTSMMEFNIFTVPHNSETFYSSLMIESTGTYTGMS